jgi:hypothetical protein
MNDLLQVTEKNLPNFTHGRTSVLTPYLSSQGLGVFCQTVGTQALISDEAVKVGTRR